MDGLNEPPSLPVEEPLTVYESGDDAEGDEQEQEEREGEREYSTHVDRYIQHLYDNDLLGSGFFDERLVNFHAPVDLSTNTIYYAKPHKKECIEDVEGTPSDHPLRVIAAVLEAAPSGSTVRVNAYSLTDMLAIDLLSHAGKSKTVRVLLHRSQDTRRSLLKWVTEVGNRRALLENIEIRLISMETVGANNAKASLNAKEIITDQHTILGSYNLSDLARAGNLEVVMVTPTQPKSIEVFDWMWEQDLVLTNQVERIYKELNYNVQPGSKRKARYDAVNAELASRKKTKANAAAADAAVGSKP